MDVINCSKCDNKDCEWLPYSKDCRRYNRNDLEQLAKWAEMTKGIDLKPIIEEYKKAAAV